MLVLINKKWHKLKEVAGEAEGVGILQFSKPIDEDTMAYMRMWFAETLVDGKPVGWDRSRAMTKVLPFAGNEVGLYEECLVDSVGSATKPYLWRISFRNRAVQTT